jgi:hypothetical protein
LNPAGSCGFAIVYNERGWIEGAAERARGGEALQLPVSLGWVVPGIPKERQYGIRPDRFLYLYSLRYKRAEKTCQVWWEYPYPELTLRSLGNVLLDRY